MTNLNAGDYTDKRTFSAARVLTPARDGPAKRVTRSQPEAASAKGTPIVELLP
jgi:hypothetical protein